jgi:hypothetical protein
MPQSMQAQSQDTDLKAEGVLVRLLRETPVYRRIEAVSSLVKTTRLLSWQGIRERFPRDTPRGRAGRFLQLLYPDLPEAKRILARLPADWGD